jgi:hypothetical protein
VIKKWYFPEQLLQPKMTTALNKDLCHAAGFVGRDYDYPHEFFREDMKRFGIVK